MVVSNKVSYSRWSSGKKKGDSVLFLPNSGGGGRREYGSTSNFSCHRHAQGESAPIVVRAWFLNRVWDSWKFIERCQSIDPKQCIPPSGHGRHLFMRGSLADLHEHPTYREPSKTHHVLVESKEVQ